MNVTQTRRSLIERFPRAQCVPCKGAALLALAALFAGTAWLAGAPGERAAVTPEARQIAATPDAAAIMAAASVRDHRQRTLAGHLSKRYRLALEPTASFVGAAHRAAEEVGLDPLLLLAVMAVESRFNPIAQSVMGAKGLMQVIPKYHMHVVSRHGGEQAMLEPDVNILVGAHILKDYIRRTGSLEAGLQFYNGSLWDESTQYAAKVIAEKDRLKQALQAAAQRI